MLKRRPLLVTPFSIWIKPRLKIRYIDVRFFKEHGADETGRIRIQLVDDIDREYWIRLKPFQYRILRFFCL